MVQLVAYHSTAFRHREAIRQYGMLPTLPHPAQYFGVYVFGEFDHPTFMKGSFRRQFRCRWDHSPKNDLWQIVYCGPLCEDQYVENGLVLFGDVTNVSLVTCNTQNV